MIPSKALVIFLSSYLLIFLSSYLLIFLSSYDSYYHPTSKSLFLNFPSNKQHATEQKINFSRSYLVFGSIFL
ncbi:hypothetical protein FCW05_09335 [Vibrio lentus]|nr:hypothetical protein FCW05_09335 [Vibrio lentus]